MDAPSFERLYGRRLTIDVCHHCQCLWFDDQEFLQMTPGATLQLVASVAEDKESDAAALGGRAPLPPLFAPAGRDARPPAQHAVHLLPLPGGGRALHHLLPVPAREELRPAAQRGRSARAADPHPADQLRQLRRARQHRARRGVRVLPHTARHHRPGPGPEDHRAPERGGGGEEGRGPHAARLARHGAAPGRAGLRRIVRLVAPPGRR